jgi:type IV pilus assembly protein PilN
VIRINLLPVREVAAEAGRRQETRLIVLGAVLVGALLLAAETGSRVRMVPVRNQHEVLRKELKELEAKATELSDLERRRAELDDKLKTIAALEQKRVGPVHVMADLSDAAPTNVWLIEFTENRGAATITGMALDNQTIATFMRNLGSSKYFTNVDLVETTQAEEDGLQLKRFVVRTRLAYDGGPVKGTEEEQLMFPKPPDQKRSRKGGRV